MSKRENPLERYITESPDAAMREIARVAVARGYTPASLARLAGYDRSSLLRQFERTGRRDTVRTGYGARDETIDRYCRSLRITARHMRAARERLADADIRKIATDLMVELRKSAFNDPRVRLDAALAKVEEVLNSPVTGETREVLRLYELTRSRAMHKASDDDPPTCSHLFSPDTQAWWLEHPSLLRLASEFQMRRKVDLFSHVRARVPLQNVRTPTHVRDWIKATWDVTRNQVQTRALLKNLLRCTRADREFTASVQQFVDGTSPETSLTEITTRSLFGGGTVEKILAEIDDEPADALNSEASA